MQWCISRVIYVFKSFEIPDVIGISEKSPYNTILVIQPKVQDFMQIAYIWSTRGLRTCERPGNGIRDVGPLQSRICHQLFSLWTSVQSAVVLLDFTRHIKN